MFQVKVFDEALWASIVKFRLGTRAARSSGPAELPK
jgi:hypothetical protein